MGTSSCRSDVVSAKLMRTSSASTPVAYLNHFFGSMGEDAYLVNLLKGSVQHEEKV